MIFSQDTNNILNFLDYSTSNSLRKRNDIGAILELSASFNELQAFEKLIFDGSSLWNIHKTLKRHSNDEETSKKLKNEYLNLITELKNQLIAIIGIEHPDLTERFNKIYSKDTAGSLANLIDLSHDLSQVKVLIDGMKKSQRFVNEDNSSKSSK